MNNPEQRLRALKKRACKNRFQTTNQYLEVILQEAFLIGRQSGLREAVKIFKKE